MQILPTISWGGDRTKCGGGDVAAISDMPGACRSREVGWRKRAVGGDQRTQLARV